MPNRRPWTTWRLYVFRDVSKKKSPVFWRRQGAVFVHGKPTSGPRLPIHPPRRHPGVERGLEGRDPLLKLLEGHTGEIQELHRARL